MARYWIIVASKNHVERGIKEGICQACHGKSGPLKRMKPNDWVIFYSPKMEFGKTVPCQEFTAIGRIPDDTVYEFEMSPDFVPWRRAVEFHTCTSTPIAPLIPELTFIKNKSHWGGAFRFGMLSIPEEDFKKIAAKMAPDVLQLLK